MNPKVSIIIPAYNEEENIPILAEELQDMISKNNLDCEVILIDDGSDDRTYKAIEECRKNYKFIKTVKHRRNFGKTEAILSGLKASSGELIVLMDADLQYSSFSIPVLIKKLDEGFDIVTGWKAGKYEKRFVSSIYNTLSRWLFKIPIHDQNAIKLLRREVMEDMQLRKDWHRYIVALACDKGYKVGEIEVELRPRRYGKSKYTGHGRIIIGILDLIAVKFQVSFMKKPLLLFGTIGGILLIVGFIAGIIAIYQRFVLQQGFRPLLYLIILLVVVGILFFILGFLAETIASVRDELKILKRK
ncbi:glycosyltransferase family 2 protein [candidate division WOR-3 bacterium]|nr:glycosyltransferase family 2 protein [candidate division WOR-3 bacterium]